MSKHETNLDKLAIDLLNSKDRHILMYARDKKTKAPYGVVLSYREGDSVYLGWSKCNLDDDDFVRGKGILTAIGKNRAFKVGPETNLSLEDLSKIPSDIVELIDKVLKVSKRKLWN